MSLFRSIMRDFDHDPFFSGQFENVRRMETMMDTMMAPFGGMMGMGFPRIAPGRDMHREQMNPFGNSLMPFGFGRSLFPNINDMFANMQETLVQPPVHSYSSSSVMTYTTDELGRPQVYQATSSTRTAPGGVKETRNSVQDSHSGLQKMAIGHHLGERAHIIEKARNRYTGEQNENQEFINLEEEEAETFNEEWQTKAQPFNRRPASNAIGYAPGNQNNVSELPAITAGPSTGPTIVEITDSPETEPDIEVESEPIIESPVKSPKSVSGSSSTSKSSASSNNGRKRDSPDLSVIGHHVHREGKHKRRHHAYSGNSKGGHRSDKAKSSRPRHETSM